MKRLAFLLIIASVIIGGASFQSADSLIKVEAKALLESTPSPVEVDNIPPVDAV